MYVSLLSSQLSHLTTTFSNSDGTRLEILWELTNNATNPYNLGTSKVDSTFDHSHPLKLDKHTEPAPTVDPNDLASWPTKPVTLTIDSRVGAFVADQPTRSGRLLVETTWWGIIQRPDYVSVLYQVGSETPLRITSSVSDTIFSQPEDALFVIGVDEQDQKIAINATQDTDVANVLASSLIQGIFYVHGKAFRWVVEISSLSEGLFCEVLSLTASL